MNKTTRSFIIKEADRLFYEQGFAHTSFADIAKAVNISRGNFYYHFKSKDKILDAVITKRIADREAMLEIWATKGETPRVRINSFISILLANSTKIKKYGCPIGTLTSELAKLNHQATKRAGGLFTVFRIWLRRQFENMGCDDEADEYALHVLARLQGIAILANAFGDDEFLKREVKQLPDWVLALAVENGEEECI
ncbi:MAG: TetR/AcrR family transcriptional regulator [Robiginitomaculum sp.]|nr:TetR/AcrR family transcriptional regulator [Robiginitomaculum sp.]